MNGAPGITAYSFLWSYLLLLPPLFLAWKWDLGINKKAVTAVARMTVQLYLMGYYLGWLFRIDNPLLNAAWITVMLVAANLSALRQRKLSLKILFFPALAGNALVFFTTVGLFMIFVVKNTSPFSARFMIPIAGMLLGNTMRGNTVALEHFYSRLREEPAEYTTRLLMGATAAEASKPYMDAAIRLSILPHIAVVSTVGIVSMPGMMTGQMLTGAVPMKAVLYQIAIMIGVFACMFMSGAVSILFSRPCAFDGFGNLKPGVFENRKG